jgi:hypothetical protein
MLLILLNVMFLRVFYPVVFDNFVILITPFLRHQGSLKELGMEPTVV